MRGVADKKQIDGWRFQNLL